MRAPAFWWRPRPSLLALLLGPAGFVYGAVAGQRMLRRGETPELPVICIGNFTAGGAGKTPTALAMAGLLRAMGEAPAFLLRGYGGTLAGPIRVADRHTAAEVGDEALLLARSGPTIVSRDRPAGVRLASGQGATVVIMDDGLQNASLVKDLAIAVVDGATGIGNGLPLPAGPLRAPMSAQWRMVDAVLIIGAGEAGDEVAAAAEQLAKPVFRGSFDPDAAMAARLKGEKVLAFAGIGRPGKFFETLKEAGAVVERAISFPDHHAFSTAEFTALREEAHENGWHLVTTEKDAMRILHAPALREAAGSLMPVPVHLRVSDHEALRELASRRLHARRSRSDA
jgi:tetraacyldisaccharide 4'-kinase